MFFSFEKNCVLFYHGYGPGNFTMVYTSYQLISFSDKICYGPFFLKLKMYYKNREVNGNKM